MARGDAGGVGLGVEDGIAGSVNPLDAQVDRALEDVLWRVDLVLLRQLLEALTGRGVKDLTLTVGHAEEAGRNEVEVRFTAGVEGNQHL